MSHRVGKDRSQIMNKSNLPTCLSALCAVLLVLTLLNQRHQTKQIESLASDPQRPRPTEKFVKNPQEAKEAVGLAKAAEKRGDLKLAKIYYLSAVNHAPSEFPVLKDYAELVFRDPSGTTDDLDRLKSVLQTSLDQIPPAFITNATGLLAKTEGQLLAKLPPLPVPVPMNWPERFEQFTKTNILEKQWTDLKQISQRLDGLNEMVESLHEEQPGSNTTKRAESELELTQRTLSGASLIAVLDRIMNALNSSTDQPEKAVSLLQTAEATLGQLWGIESAGWPIAMRAKIDQYPKEIQRRVEIVAEVKSRPYSQKVAEALKSAQLLTDLMSRLLVSRDPDDFPRRRAVTEEFRARGITIQTNGALFLSMPIPLTKAGAYQRMCLHFSTALQSAEASRLEISSASGRQKADLETEIIRLLFVEAKRRQLDAYQKWAVDECGKAFELTKATWGGVGERNDVARIRFQATKLDQVDQSLLIPETSRLFNDVVGKFTAPMNGTGQFESQKQLAETPKKRLEEF